MNIVKAIGPSDRVARYEVPDTELAVGCTLGGPKAACIVKATGAIQTVYSIDIGQSVFGTVLLRHYDAQTGMHLSHDQPGTFRLHAGHQEHRFSLPRQIAVHETVFVLSGAPEKSGKIDPPGVYLSVALRNDGPEPVQIVTYAIADLRGNTGHDVVAEYDKHLHALVAWNKSQPDWVRVFGGSDPPDTYETTLDMGRAVARVCPGPLSDKTDAPTDPLGVLHNTRTIKPGQTVEFSYLLSFGQGRTDAAKNYHACPPAADALAKTRAHYQDVLERAVLITPNPEVNRGVLWAKANMLRVMVKSATGWCFVNDPTRSNNSVGRDTAWFAYGGDYLNPEFSRDALLAYVRNQEPSGKVVEYYDIRTGQTADYKLNINDDTPLLILALWHHYTTTGNSDFLQEVYSAAAKAARYILSQRNEQGLVWCTSTGVSDWGIVGWRNVIENYRLSGATTEVNSECYAALTTIAQMARTLGRHDESLAFTQQADALKTAINTHLKNPDNGLYYLNIDVDGFARSDVTSDLVFPVMFGVADEETSAKIISRLSDADFWTSAGMRTTPRDAPNYSPNLGWGLLGGVWVGISFWFAFAAARYNPEFMDRALSDSFKNFTGDPRRNSTVPGQFSEWLHGETLTNDGMMLSPWDPPRYLWAAIEGVAGVTPSGDSLSVQPRLSADWKWMGVKNLPYRAQNLSFFVVRTPDLQMYTNFHPQQSLPYQAYDDDISAFVETGLDAVCTLGLRQGERMILFAGNTGEQTVSTSLRVGVPLSGQYRARLYESLLGQWVDRGLIAAERFKEGHVLQIERKGFCLLELMQEV